MSSIATFDDEAARLMAECLAEIEKPLPPNCRQRGWPQSRTCRLAGGCPICYAELIGKRNARAKEQ